MKGNGKKAHATRREADRIRHLEGQVRDNLIRAAAAMTEPSPENKGVALFYATLATIRLAESDAQGAAEQLALSMIRAASGRPAQRQPGPYSGT